MPAGTKTPRPGAREVDTAGGGADTRCNPHGRSAATVSPSDRTPDGALRHGRWRSGIKAPVSWTAHSRHRWTCLCMSRISGPFWHHSGYDSMVPHAMHAIAAATPAVASPLPCMDRLARLRVEKELFLHEPEVAALHVTLREHHREVLDVPLPVDWRPAVREKRAINGVRQIDVSDAREAGSGQRVVSILREATDPEKPTVGQLEEVFLPEARH